MFYKALCALSLMLCVCLFINNQSAIVVSPSPSHHALNPSLHKQCTSVRCHVLTGHSRQEITSGLCAWLGLYVTRVELMNFKVTSR